MAKSKKQTSDVLKFLLVALVILGIVVVVILAGGYFLKKEVIDPAQQNMIDAGGKARDTARKSAMHAYSLALELYKSKNNRYPISVTCASPQSFNLEIGNPPKEPFRDPSFSKQDSSWPDFCYQSDAKGAKFTIWTKLENSGDDKTSQINTTPYFAVPSGFEPNYYFMQSEE